MGSKSYKLNTFRSYIGLRFKNHVKITSESYFRLTLGSSVIKTCKWDQKIRSKYVWKLRQDYVTKVMLELRQKVTLG